MGAIASLGSAHVSVAPGAEARAELKVRNNGSVVDQMSISILGDAGGWASAEPPTLSLFPGAEGTTTIVFRPPRDSSVRAGQLPFGVRVASQEDPAGSVVEEGRLDIGAFSELTAELQPMTSRGARGARHDLAVDNRGNVPLNATISGIDSSEEVGFDIRPPSVVADPGQATFAQVDVKPRRRYWRGQPKTRSFIVQVEAAGQPPVPVGGTFLQEPMLPGWLIKSLIALAALALALILFWFFLLQPSLLAAAEERAEEVLASAGITPGTQTPGGNGNGNGNGNGDGGGNGTGLPPASGGGNPVAGRIVVGGDPVTASEGMTLFVTDLVFSNASAESGPLRLRRNGGDLLSLRLENFRDLDFHFVTPIVFGPDDRMELNCPSCSDAAVFYTGYER